MEITGGVFSSKVPEAYCAVGYKPTDIINGFYTVCNHPDATHCTAKAAICGRAGNPEYWYCDTCGRYFSDSACKNEIPQAKTVIAVDPNAHTLKKSEARAATCTAEGNTKYWTCSVCGKLFSDEAGTTETTKDAVTIAATGHSYGSEWKQDGTRHWHECSVCGEKSEGTAHACGEWTVTKAATGTEKGRKQRTCSVCGYAETEEIPVIGVDIQTQIVRTKLTEAPEGLKNTKFNTVEAITAELTRVAVSYIGYTAENTVVSDVKLQISTDGGKTWFDATEENFPANGITIVLPYPEGTGKDTHDFVVTHMFTVTSERLGATAGKTETPAVRKLDNGIQVTLKGLSPVSISWKAVSASTDKPASSTTSPQTGDSSNMALWFTLMAISVPGIGGALLYGRKRRTGC